jgi:hypothetical protein
VFTAWILSIGAGLFGKAGELLGVASALRDAQNEKLRLREAVEKSHRETWALVLSMPASKALYDRTRDLAIRPRTDEETNAVRLLLRHFAWAFSLHCSGRYDLPEQLPNDVRNFFSYPVRRDAWNDLQRFHDKRLVSYVNGILASV